MKNLLFLFILILPHSCRYCKTGSSDTFGSKVKVTKAIGTFDELGDANIQLKIDQKTD
ncbi:hypothetical protein [Kaistella jeonii]|uniref:hypothetical protein n=1 Tax=Kaistella jeonii TaxID=266749 RepID=UPI0008EE4A37|nr:hypothetical protein [Kaistella jeonii]SFC10378.1 hypothetical protein SAMN05421876_106155 [Kaistella jeonii]VEI95275.1 Uncharacterised protein [Kaistella jeonii]